MGYYLTLTSTLQLVFDLVFFLLLLSNSSFSKRLKLLAWDVFITDLVEVLAL